MQIIEQSFECLTTEDFSTWAERIEKIARVCYKSEDKITDGSAAILIDKLIHKEHNTMIEFCDLTFKFVVDTKIAGALGRHRLTTQAHESTHYIDYIKKGELIFVRQIEGSDSDNAIVHTFYKELEELYFTLDMPHTLKRVILPFGLRTEMVIKANLSEWRHILRLRTSGKDTPQMTALMRELLEWFRKELPHFVKDINYDV